MKLSVAALAALFAALPTALAGLEDARYSTVLTPSNFDGVIASQSEGTLVAFFAPWCGHCKSLEPVWTKIAEAFDGDDRCKVAHFNADDAAARPLASKYGVSGFPTIKFIPPPSKGGQAEAYQGPRTEQAFLEFLNEHCGTHKLPGGLLSDLAGRIPSLDSLAASYLVPTATRPSILESAFAIVSSLTSASSSDQLANYYVKVMNRFKDVADASGVDEARAWVEKERIRLGKIASKRGQVAAKKLEEARMKQNILAAFASASASASSLSSVASATASSLSSAGSSAASAASVASNSASSAASVASNSASSLAAEATASATSLASEASKTVGSVADEASATVVSAYQKVKGEL
ncbi:hypothetical protein NBRC10512_007202 [Rhodotorula toruloides]|uniref:protein disulfide-isomerase n=2 Tax=Rhodotorula toruloides TaxID=5286 RepID=A0A061BLC6_RHOTO|nr:protein disulfide-isomerase A6 [Rhodotorula toruloides NP11]EMS19519.1 protein disulfide-isomerase A6 [Rhodotorula toruloides NP11]CDR48773.1 RHTO0S20e01090g1_1 [Rhodotorula toruloides]